MGKDRKVVLVVDDDPVTRRLMLEFLRGDGYRTASAENGKRALARLRRGPCPCLVLLDLRMPVMSGRELLDVLRDHPRLRTIPVLLVTGEPIEHAGNGVEGILRKPVEPRELLQAVARHCA